MSTITPTRYAPPTYQPTARTTYDNRFGIGAAMTIIATAVLVISVIVGKATQPRGSYVSFSEQADWTNTVGWCVIFGAGSLFVILLGVILMAGAERR